MRVPGGTIAESEHWKELAMSEIGEKIAHRVRELNDAWRSERFSELEQYFHPDVILVHPRFEMRTAGRDALIASYADFASKSRILEFAMEPAEVDVIASSAVATSAWRMKYEYESVVSDESGWDVLIFNQHEGSWVVVWRTVVLDTADATSSS
jgi:ketosteroid isomerase-like protein